MAERSGEVKARLEKDLDTTIRELTVYFDGDGIVLARGDGDLYLLDGSAVWKLGSSGYEPCTYLLRGGRVCTAIHNAFTEGAILALAKNGGTLRSVTGTEYPLGRLCRLLAFAARFADCGIDWLEGKLAIETLKALGATSPETAVPPGELGLRYVPSAVSHSKRLDERLMLTGDGRAYVRIKGQPGGAKRPETRQREARDVAKYSESDLEAAAEFREGVHREALAKLRKLHPGITEVYDPYPVEEYFQDVWEYPGKWYTYVAVPKESGGRDNLIGIIVRATLARRRGRAGGDSPEQTGMAEAAAGPEETGLPADARHCPDDPFYGLLAEYPDLAVDYCIVESDPSFQGRKAHWVALAWACQRLMTDDETGEAVWHWDVSKARGKPIEAASLFSSAYPKNGLNYRKAFLYPPHENSYSGADFARVNAALFPEGTEHLEAYEWTTDWSDYFDEGHEWWGALCLTVYDRRMDRFAVLLASATD